MEDLAKSENVTPVTWRLAKATQKWQFWDKITR